MWPLAPKPYAATMSRGAQPPTPRPVGDGIAAPVVGGQQPGRPPERPAPALPWAPQADVVRAAQRDADFVGQLQRDLATVVTSYIGTLGPHLRMRTWSWWRLTARAAAS